MTNEEKIKEFHRNKFNPNSPLDPAYQNLEKAIRQDEEFAGFSSSLEDKGLSLDLEESDSEDELSLLDSNVNEFDSLEEENEVNMTERSYELKSLYGEVDERK